MQHTNFLYILSHLERDFLYEMKEVSVKFSSVIHLTVDDYYLRGFGFISISV